MPKSIPELIDSVRQKFRDFKIEDVENLIPDNVFIRAVAADLLINYFNQGALYLVFDPNNIREWAYLEGYEIDEDLVAQIGTEIKCLYFDDSDTGFRKSVFFKIHDQEVRDRSQGIER